MEQDTDAITDSLSGNRPSPSAPRLKRRRKREKEPSIIVTTLSRQWKLLLAIVLFVVGLALVANALRFVPVASLQTLAYSATGRLLFTYLGALMVASSLGLGLAQWREQATRNPANWSSRNCPHCGATEYKRLARKPRHHLLSRVTRIPYRRYICAACGDKTLLIDESRIL